MLSLNSNSEPDEYTVKLSPAFVHGAAVPAIPAAVAKGSPEILAVAPEAVAGYCKAKWRFTCLPIFV